MLVYLAGAIEYAPDGGATWRRELTPFLERLGWAVYDPARDEKKSLTPEERAGFRGWKATDLARFQATVRKIIDWDLDLVESRCDCVIAHWDQWAQRGAGTAAELTTAYRLKKPVYLVAGIPVPEISGWILGCATHVVPTFDALRALLAGTAAVAG